MVKKMAKGYLIINLVSKGTLEILRTINLMGMVSSILMMEHTTKVNGKMTFETVKGNL